MPAVKPNPLEQSRRIVRACIAGNMELYNVDDNKAAQRIYRSKRNFQDKYKEPEDFTLGEFWQLQKDLKFTPMQAATILLGREVTVRDFEDYILR